MRGAELDAGGTGLEQCAGLGRHLIGRAGEREAVEDRVGDQPTGPIVVSGADQALHRGQVDRLEAGRRIQRGDDGEVGGHLRAG